MKGWGLWKKRGVASRLKLSGEERWEFAAAAAKSSASEGPGASRVCPQTGGKSGRWDSVGGLQAPISPSGWHGEGPAQPPLTPLLPS